MVQQLFKEINTDKTSHPRDSACLHLQHCLQVYLHQFQEALGLIFQIIHVDISFDKNFPAPKSKR